jgi:hypothetical protein
VTSNKETIRPCRSYKPARSTNAITGTIEPKADTPISRFNIPTQSQWMSDTKHTLKPAAKAPVKGTRIPSPSHRRIRNRPTAKEAAVSQDVIDYRHPLGLGWMRMKEDSGSWCDRRRARSISAKAASDRYRLICACRRGERVGHFSFSFSFFILCHSGRALYSVKRKSVGANS